MLPSLCSQDTANGPAPPLPAAPLPPRPAASSGCTPLRSNSMPLGGAGAVSSPSRSGAQGLRPAASCPPGALPEVRGFTLDRMHGQTPW